MHVVNLKWIKVGGFYANLFHSLIPYAFYVNFPVLSNEDISYFMNNSSTTTYNQTIEEEDESFKLTQQMTEEDDEEYWFD